ILEKQVAAANILYVTSIQELETFIALVMAVTWPDKRYLCYANNPIRVRDTALSFLYDQITDAILVVQTLNTVITKEAETVTYQTNLLILYMEETNNKLYIILLNRKYSTSISGTHITV
ncbi:hypothetical protein ACJX0J_028742, partial [Zea mays]